MGHDEVPTTATATAEPTLSPPSGSSDSDDVVIEKQEEPSTANRILIVVTIGVLIFMGSLDSSVVATLNPTLTAEFQSGQDIGWYGSIFLVIVGATLPLFGRLINIFSPKMVLLGSLLILEIGCLICAVSKNSPTFIAGRAFAGLGCAGLLSSGLTITAVITPLRQRPMFQAIISSLEGIATTVGPTIGGVMADTIGWRWAFWINLPVGGLFALILFFFMHPPEHMFPRKDPDMKATTKLARLDWVGAVTITGCVVCLLLALQLGGSTYPWGSGRVIALFVVFGVSLAAIGYYERRLGDAAVFPVRLLRNRRLVGALFFGFCISSSQWIIIYYLPLWYQAVQRASAYDAGIRVIPMTLAQVIIASIAAVATSAVGYLAPFVVASTVFSSIGCGLAYTLVPGSALAQSFGYQVLLGAGYGIGISQSIVNGQAVVETADVGFATSAVLLGNIVGGSVFISVAQAVFADPVLKLAAELPGLGRDVLDDIGSIDRLLSPADQARAIGAYSHGLKNAFLMALVLAAASCLAWPFTHWASIKSKEPKKKEEEPVVVAEKGTAQPAT